MLGRLLCALGLHKWYYDSPTYMQPGWEGRGCLRRDCYAGQIREVGTRRWRNG